MNLRRPWHADGQHLLKLALLSTTALAGLSQLALGQTYIGGTDVVTVPGTHATPWDAGSLYIGIASGDDAELQIGVGGLPGTVLSTTVYVGNTAGARGVALLAGAGSEWFAGGQFSVGFGGAGLVEVEDSATLNTNNAVVFGRLAGSDGQMQVRDATWNINGTTGAIYLGYEGAGSLLIEDGAVVNASGRAARIGYMASGEGSVTITDVGSSWSVEALIVGDEGTGVLTLQNGGAVTLNGGSGTLNIARVVGSTGHLNIGGLVDGGGASAPEAAGTLNASFVSFGSAGGRLNFNHTETNYLFNIPISGNGFVRQFAGTTILDGLHTYTGGTQVIGGALHVNGSIADSTVTVLGGRLAGTGVLGNALVTNTGTHAPGNSIGTQTVNGNYHNNGTLEIEVEPGASDQIIVNGTVTISGAVLDIVELTAIGWTPAEAFTIIVNDGGDAVVGTFGAINNTLAFLTPSVNYAGGDGNDVVVTMLRNDIGFASTGQTPNQIATAGAAEALGAGNPIYAAILALTPQQAQAASDALSGEIHPSSRGALFQDSRFIRDAATNRLRAAFDGVGSAGVSAVAYGPDGPQAAMPHTNRFVMWGQAFGGWGQADSDGNAAKLDWSTGGLHVGGDNTLGPWRVGVVGGYSKTDFSAKSRVSSGDSENYHAGLYAGRTWGALGLRSGLAYTYHDITTERSAAFAGFNERLSGEHDGRTFQTFGELGYRIGGSAASFEPFANFAYVDLHTGAFTERGGNAVLLVRAASLDTGLTTVGLRASAAMDVAGAKIGARGSIGWRHAFGDVATVGQHAFAGGNAFTIRGVPLAEDAAIIEAGLDVQLSPFSSFGISYDGQFGDGMRDQSAKGQLVVRF